MYHVYFCNKQLRVAADNESLQACGCLVALKSMDVGSEALAGMTVLAWELLYMPLRGPSVLLLVFL